MIDVDKAISTATKTGKVSFGAIAAQQNAQTGRAKLIIVAANCPQEFRDKTEYYCKLSNVPFITYKGSALDLAAVCGKPFSVSALSIREPGDSEILKVTESVKSEEPNEGNE
jgi:large subunit ribosomal protein L30e